MSSPIPIPTRKHASPSSPALYVPVHRRPGSYTSSSSRTSSRSSSPSSSPALSPFPFPSFSSSTHPTLIPTPSPTPKSTPRHTSTPASTSRGIYTYTPAELLLLSTSPLAKLSAGDVDALRALAPEVVQTRKRRKALAWHARHPAPPTPTDAQRSRKRTSSRGSHAHTSESEEDRATSWRRI